ncbi:hypothetical protein BGZ91_005424, partial [Linnemannia elongata]
MSADKDVKDIVTPMENAAIATEQKAEQIVDPWNVQGAVVDGKQMGIDYDRLIESFGTRAIDEA